MAVIQNAGMNPLVVKERAAFGGASIVAHFNDLGLVAMKTKEISLNKGSYNKIGISYMAVRKGIGKVDTRAGNFFFFF